MNSDYENQAIGDANLYESSSLIGFQSAQVKPYRRDFSNGASHIGETRRPTGDANALAHEELVE